MHGIEHCDQECRTLRLLAPRPLVWSTAGLTLPDTPQNCSQSGPDAHNGLSLTCNGCPFRSLHSRVKVPGLLFRRPPRLFLRPFGSSAPLPDDPVSPGSGGFHASSPLRIPCLVRPAALFQSPLPFRSFSSLRIKAF